MKILLLLPPSEGEVTEFNAANYIISDFAHYPPLGLLAIATGIDPKHTVKVLDSVTKKMSIDEVMEQIKDFNPDLLGLSVVSRRLFPTYEVFRRTKEILPNTTIIAGGPHINDFPIETMEGAEIDFAISGYAETSFPQFVEALEQGESSLEYFEKVPGLCYRVGDEIRHNPEEEVPLVLDD